MRFAFLSLYLPICVRVGKPADRSGASFYTAFYAAKEEGAMRQGFAMNLTK